MIREITFALHENAQILSGNQISRMHFHAQRSREKRQQRVTLVQLCDAFGRCPPRVVLADGRRNTFRVTLTRISKGTGFDAHDSLRQGGKAFVDAISAYLFHGPRALALHEDRAAWKKIAGRDDGRAGLEWLYDQQRSTQLVGVRIRIEDLEEGDDVIVYRDAPGLMGSASPSRPTKPARFQPPEQQRLPLGRRAWLALPWEQDPASDELVNLHEADKLTALLEAPAQIRVKDPRDPSRRREVTLYRHDHTDPALGGRVWLFCDCKPAPVGAIDTRKAS